MKKYIAEHFESFEHDGKRLFAINAKTKTGERVELCVHDGKIVGIDTIPDHVGTNELKHAVQNALNAIRRAKYLIEDIEIETDPDLLAEQIDELNDALVESDLSYYAPAFTELYQEATK